MTDEEKCKLATWNDVMRLLSHYRDIAFDPLYQPPKGVGFVSKEHAAVRERKQARIGEYEDKLTAKWKAALGPYWRSAIEPD